MMKGRTTNNGRRKKAFGKKSPPCEKKKRKEGSVFTRPTRHGPKSYVRYPPTIKEIHVWEKEKKTRMKRSLFQSKKKRFRSSVDSPHKTGKTILAEI